ncbi:PhzF family phenazine biosynthesis protein [Ideonella sp.]|uniref:PhzF family phenazine biosynthesis protein n=1 Tax=Ideonella sp. TaxID=1929293 RepID=UPI002CE02840|nr:PhzF family phenazine biosynthesis protein [Ramlibacter sp.]
MSGTASRKFSQLDVFTDTPLRGNPLAVVHDADGLSDTQMAAFARWTNLSETTFLLKPTEPGADYRVRIFTPTLELPFAGHPTLGSCHAWLAAGGQPGQAGEVVQQCTKGLVRIRRDGTRLAFAAPPCERREVAPALLAAVLDAIGLAADELVASQWLDNGPQWLALQLRSAERLLALRPDNAKLKSLAWVGLVAPQPAGADTQFEVRAFIAPDGIEEDPVTGSLNASLAGWLMERGEAPAQYVAAQGSAMGRAGRIHVHQDGDSLWIGGDVADCIEGQIRL